MVIPSKNLDLIYTRDNEGRIATMADPNGGSYSYTYTTLGQLRAMTDTATGAAVVTEARYGPAGEMTEYIEGTAPWSEERTYNVLGQLVHIFAPAFPDAPPGSPLWNYYHGLYPQAIRDVEYTYSATQNNGQIESSKDNISGEQIMYAYDGLSRLTSAVTADSPQVAQWGLRFSYDGWGNRTEQAVTKGSAPVNSFSYDPATNRLLGAYTYDGNGNLKTAPGLTSVEYDVENRLRWYVAAGNNQPGMRDGYGPDNRRTYRVATQGGSTGDAYGPATYWFWSDDGKVLGSYTAQLDANGVLKGYTTVESYRYFGSHRVGEFNDRLGSNVGGGKKYFPYGEEYSVTAGDGYKFATYYRESATNLDYADQRWYSSSLGRFLTADPYQASGRGMNPGSWNRYAYVTGDPVNGNDPTGLDGYFILNPPDPISPPQPEPNPLFMMLAFNSMNSGPPSTFDVVDAMRMQSDFARTNARLHADLAEAIRGLSPDCYKALGIAPNDLIAVSQKVFFYDTTTSVGQLTQNQVSHNGDNTTLRNTWYGQANAYVVPNGSGGLTNAIVVKEPANPDLNITLIHELLHYAFQSWDDTFRANEHIPERFGKVDSLAISAWLKEGCPRQ